MLFDLGLGNCDAMKQHQLMLSTTALSSSILLLLIAAVPFSLEKI